MDQRSLSDCFQMRRLPPELKVDIFRHLIPVAVAHGIGLIYQYRSYSVESKRLEGPFDPIPFLWAVYQVAGVCQEWRALVQGTPDLWTTVVFPLFTMINYQMAHPDSLLETIQQHLLRSGTRPLDIHVVSFWHDDTHFPAFFAALWAHRARIRSLTVPPQPAPAYGMRATTIHNPPDLPTLNHLAISSDELYYWNRKAQSPLNRCRSLSLIIPATMSMFEPPTTYDNIQHLTIILMAYYSGRSLTRWSHHYTYMLNDTAARWTFHMISQAVPNLRSLDIYFPSNIDRHLARQFHRFITDFQGVKLDHLTSARFHGYDTQPMTDHRYPTHLSNAMKDFYMHPNFFGAAVDLLTASKCDLTTLQIALPTSWSQSRVPLALYPRIANLLSLTLCADAGTSDAVTQLCDVAFVPKLQELTLTVLDNEIRFGFDSMAKLKELLESRKLLRLSADTSAMIGELEKYMDYFVGTGVQCRFAISCENDLSARFNTDDKQIKRFRKRVFHRT